MAAYSIARNMSKRKAFTIMYTLLILGIFVPFQVIMIPITVMMSKLGLANTFGLILLYLTYAIPQTLFLYVGYIKSRFQKVWMKQQRSMGLINSQPISVSSSQ